MILLPLLGACSSSKDIAQDGSTNSPPTTTTATATTPTSSPTEPTTAEPSTPSQSETSTSPEDNGRLEGNSYSVVIPPGWSDITATVKAAQPSVDVAKGEGHPTGFRTNFNVVNSASDPGTIEANGPAIRQEAATELKSITKSRVTPLPDRQIDGEEAIGQTSTFVNASTVHHLLSSTSPSTTRTHIPSR